MPTNTTDEILNIKANANTSDVDALTRQIADLEDRLSHLEGAGRDAGEGADKAEGAFSKLMATAADLTLVTGGLSQAWGVAQDVFKNTLGAVFDQEKSFRLLQAQTGATADEMAMFREEAEDMFVGGFGEDMNDVVAAMSQVERVTDAGGDALEGMTADALILRDVFEADVRESIQAADNMMNTFQISGEEAFDLLTAGFQATGDPGGDLLEVFTEYSPAFKRMGLSAKQSMSLLNQGLKAGARNTEFVADGLREFNTRLSDGSSKEALAALGLENMFDRFQRGEVDAATVLESVTQALSGVENEAQRAAIGAQIFGAKFEDMPGVFEALDLTSLSDEFQDVTNASENMTSSMQSGLEPAWDRLKRAGSQALKDALTPFVTTLADKAVPILEKIVPFLDRVGTRLEWAFGMGRTEGVFEIKKILDELGLGTLAPLVDIADDAISTFGRFFDAFKEDGLSGVLDQAMTEIKNAAPVLFETAKNLAKEHIITPLWNELKDPANWQAAGSFLLTLTKDLLGLQWDAAMWIGENLITPMWNQLTNRDNWIEASNFARKLVGEILGKAWSAGLWMRTHIIDPAWAALTNRDNWIEASNFARKLVGEILGKAWSAGLWMRTNIIDPAWAALTSKDNWADADNFLRKLFGSVLGVFWDAGQWVRDNIIDPIQREINNLWGSLNVPSIPNPFSGGGGSNNAPVLQGALGAFSNQINLAPGQSYAPRNYNTNYTGPRSATVLRDHGGRGERGQPYLIGKGAQPELFVPDSDGSFYPNAGGGMQPVTVQLVLDGRVIYETYVKEESRRNPGGRRRQ